MNAIHLTITGRVQGVFFRAETKKKADELGITGWVRNNEDGTVEVHGESKADALQVLETWCQNGPPMARVDRVEKSEADVENFDSFTSR
jgi:acylphosphatase